MIKKRSDEIEIVVVLVVAREKLKNAGSKLSWTMLELTKATWQKAKPILPLPEPNETSKFNKAQTLTMYVQFHIRCFSEIDLLKLSLSLESWKLHEAIPNIFFS